MNTMHFLGDIGRTNMRFAASRGGETIGEPMIRPTPADFNVGLALIEKLIGELRGDGMETVQGLCLGVSRKVWLGAPLKSELEKNLDCPVLIENDAALVGLGEAHYGAGRGSNLLAYVTVSTGVGGVKIEDGRIDGNALGFEPGQQIIIVDGQTVGRLEDYVSGAAVTARFGRPAREITDEQIWQDLSRYLAIGLTNSLLHWSPDCLVLGGSMFKAPGFKVEVIDQLIHQYLTIFPSRPAIKRAALGDLGGLWGALVCLKQRLV